MELNCNLLVLVPSLTDIAYSLPVEGCLKGFDKLDNIVLDNCIEFLRGRSLSKLIAFIYAHGV